jgi:hypothetical protein
MNRPGRHRGYSLCSSALLAVLRASSGKEVAMLISSRDIALFCGTLTFAMFATFIAASPVNAQGFRMETDVFRGDQKEPICRTLTLFTDGLVYDFILSGDSKEVTVFDMNSGRVILLDSQRSLKTILTHEQLIRLTTSLKLEINSDNPVFHFAANPKFATKFDDANGLLTLSSDRMTYRVQGKPAELSDAPRQYQELADWSARLNACRPGNLPPFARLELNRELAERELIPFEVDLTIVVPGRLGSSRKLEMKTRHLVNWALGTNDRKRIESVSQQIGKFEAVSFETYTKPEKVAKR